MTPLFSLRLEGRPCSLRPGAWDPSLIRGCRYLQRGPAMGESAGEDMDIGDISPHVPTEVTRSRWKRAPPSALLQEKQPCNKARQLWGQDHFSQHPRSGLCLLLETALPFLQSTVMFRFKTPFIWDSEAWQYISKRLKPDGPQITCFPFFFFFYSKLFHTHTHTQNIQLGFCPNADTCFFLQILKIYHRKVSLFSGQLWLV